MPESICAKEEVHELRINQLEKKTDLHEDEINHLKTTTAIFNLNIERMLTNLDKMPETIEKISTTMTKMEYKLQSVENTATINGQNISLLEDKIDNKITQLNHKVEDIDEEGKFNIRKFLKDKWIYLVTGGGLVIYFGQQIIDTFIN